MISGVALVVVAILVVAFAGGNKDSQQPAIEAPDVQQPVELPPRGYDRARAHRSSR